MSWIKTCFRESSKVEVGVSLPFEKQTIKIQPNGILVAGLDGLEHFFSITPTDFHIFFRGVGILPTRMPWKFEYAQFSIHVHQTCQVDVLQTGISMYPSWVQRVPRNIYTRNKLYVYTFIGTVDISRCISWCSSYAVNIYPFMILHKFYINIVIIIMIITTTSII